MANITVREAKAWADKFKLDLTALDSDLEESVASQVLARLSPAYDTSIWTNESNTPTLVRSIISMVYMAWYYQRTYSEDTDISTYGILLLERADALIENIISGKTALVDAVPIGGATAGTASFYPTDASSAQESTYSDPSLGGPRFTMGTIW